jgi:hypothetical protein
MYCRTCSQQIELARITILPNTLFCSSCAKKHNFIKPKKGIMVFDHKTGGTIQIMSEKSYKENKKYYIPFGARSVVKNFSKNICA